MIPVGEQELHASHHGGVDAPGAVSIFKKIMQNLHRRGCGVRVNCESIRQTTIRQETLRRYDLVGTATETGYINHSFFVNSHKGGKGSVRMMVIRQKMIMIKWMAPKETNSKATQTVNPLVYRRN